MLSIGGGAEKSVGTSLPVISAERFVQIMNNALKRFYPIGFIVTGKFGKYTVCAISVENERTKLYKNKFENIASNFSCHFDNLCLRVLLGKTSCHKRLTQSIKR